MSYETINIERTDAALVISINRPRQRNAISRQAIDEIGLALTEANEDKAVRGVILTGGAGGFSAGADLNDAQSLDSAQAAIEYFGKWHGLCASIEFLSKPVVAAIEGFCMTGGLEVALACDLRVAARSARFAITSSRIGTVAGAGGTQRLARLVGRSNALDILFSAEPLGAEDAYRMGLVNRLVDDGSALAEAKRMVALYATRAPLSLAMVKRAVYRGLDMDLASALEFEAYLVSTIYGTDDRREGIAAFLEKREPRFKGQ
jgi:enoyl-CoA hydratase/carnithine racemase